MSAIDRAIDCAAEVDVIDEAEETAARAELARLRAIEARYESDIEEALWFGIDYRDGGGFKDDVLAAWNERAEIGRKR